MPLMRRVRDRGFHLLHLVDAAPDGLEVGQHAAQPPLVHKEHVGTFRFFFQDVGRLTLGPDEQDRLAGRHRITGEGIGLFHPIDRLLKVDDVDAVSLAEEEPLHLRVPTVGLVSEMDARFQ